MEYMTQVWRIGFEAIPVAVAFFVIILGLFKAVTLRTKESRTVAWLSVTSAILLVIAQTSWSWTMFIKKDLLGTDFANIIWTWFNTIVMCSMLYALKAFEK